MGGVSDKGLSPVATFPAGLNNVTDETAFPLDENGGTIAFAAGENIDIDDAGNLRRARGYDYVFEGVAHSLHARQDRLLAVVDGELCAFRDDGAGLVYDRALVADRPRPLCYATDDDENTYWSDGVLSGRIGPDLSTVPLWIDTPDPVSLSALPNGAMAAGAYDISVTVIDAEGRESGASAPTVIRLATGQGIRAALPTAPTGAVGWRVYITAPDGEMLYLAAELPIGTTTTDIAHGPRGRQLETAWLFPLPPCTMLVHAMGRLFGITERNLLVWSEPFRLGLMHADNHLRLGTEATMLAAVGDGSEAQGLFAADHKRTYWFAGADPASWQQVVRRDSAVVPGSAGLAPGTVFNLETETLVAFWVERNGTMCLGMPGGNVIPIREGEVALPVDAERGAAAYFGFNGVRQVVTSLIGGGVNPMAAARDTAELTVRRNGVVT